MHGFAWVGIGVTCAGGHCVSTAVGGVAWLYAVCWVGGVVVVLRLWARCAGVCAPVNGGEWLTWGSVGKGSVVAAWFSLHPGPPDQVVAHLHGGVWCVVSGRLLAGHAFGRPL